VTVAVAGSDGSAATSFTLPVQVAIRPAERVTAPTTLDPPAGSVIGGRVYLAGTMLQQRQEGGSTTLDVNLKWVPLELLDRDYQVFVHLLDAQGRVAAQDDSAPAGGKRPSSVWDVSEEIQDRHSLALTGLHGEFSLEVGLYDPPSGERLGVLTLPEKVSLA
jgi:hypothetical protein